MTFIKSLSVFMPEIMAKLTIRSTRDDGTEFFEILAGVLHGDTFALFLFIITLDYALGEATSETHAVFMLTLWKSS